MMRPAERANPHRMDEGLQEDESTQGHPLPPDTESEARREQKPNYSKDMCKGIHTAPTKSIRNKEKINGKNKKILKDCLFPPKS